ncbi:hypothetical protein [Allobaculum sp. JKK-2023]|uniref:hypothetical protein n=1 Tax=Allobaculum sp. JKK-2023 TaxID=3108943 RepID=UPI002B057AD0|nr:hypothetical protein [Allobaculum sp. JKK-2023]
MDFAKQKTKKKGIEKNGLKGKTALKEQTGKSGNQRNRESGNIRKPQTPVAHKGAWEKGKRGKGLSIQDRFFRMLGPWMKAWRMN